MENYRQISNKTKKTQGKNKNRSNDFLEFIRFSDRAFIYLSFFI